MEAGVTVISCVVEVSSFIFTNINYNYSRLLCNDILYTMRMLLMCFLLLACPSLTAPSNGMISCSLGGDGIPSTGDICIFTCDTGYELTGSSVRTCQSDGSWSGSGIICTRGR